MKKDYYQHTEAQKKFLALVPEYEGDFDKLWREGQQAIDKMDRMIGKNDRPHPHTQSTDITKLMYRAILWLKKYIGDEKSDWTNVDLSRAASEVAQANPLFGFGLKGKGSYEAKLESEYRKIKELGLVTDAEGIDAAIEQAKKFVPEAKILEYLLQEGIPFNQELAELKLVQSYKRVVAEILLEDAEHQLLQWFESLFLRDPKPQSLEDDRKNLSPEDARLRTLFFELHQDYRDREQGMSIIKQATR